MHEGQVSAPAGALADAIAAQFPQLGRPEVCPVTSAGTVIAPFRVGPTLLARVPLVPDADDATAGRTRAEGRHARNLREHLPIAVPRLVGIGTPFRGYPGVWSLWTWLEGESLDLLLDRRQADSHHLDVLALDLAAALRAQRSMPADGSGWSGNGRGGRPLTDTDWVRRSIDRCSHLIDPVAATHVWETALSAPAHTGEPMSINGDPMPGNLLMSDGKLSGIVDIGSPVVGDPAADLQPAWEIFDEPQRAVFLDAMDVDRAARERGRGWAFEMAIGGLHYYEHSNPMFFRLARRTLERLIATS